MKIGYFLHSNITPSETFIFDLITELNKQDDIDLTVFGGNKNHQIKGINNLKVVSTGFYEKGRKTSFNLYKIGQIIGGKGFLLKNKHQQRCAYKALNNKILNRDKPNIAYIEYASSAINCYKYFIQNKIPFIVHIHGYDVTSATNDNIYKRELFKVLGYAKFIITPSIYLKRIVIELGCEPNKIHPIYPITNFNNIKEINYEQRRKISFPTITFLGRLTSKKNPIALILAFNLVIKKVQNAKLNILGDGELFEEVKNLTQKLNLTNHIKLFGSVERDVAFQILQNSHIYAQHSVTSLSGDQEGFPVSLAEAAAHALPIVSTIHSGITENIIDGKTGFLVQEHNFEAMADKIIYLIKNPDVAEQMGKAGRDHILELCGNNARVNKIKDLFANITQNNLT